MEKKMGIAALVLGIIGLCSSLGLGSFGLGWVGSLCSILAIIFGAVAKKKGDHTSQAKAGLILGIIALVWGIVATIVCFVCVGVAGTLSGVLNSL